MPSSRKRLDMLLAEMGLAPSRQRAKALIMAGHVHVDGRQVDKAGTPVDPASTIEIRGKDHPFVSRGGAKLAAALQGFDISVRDLVCMDVGASTGGFTDCLIQNHARRVYAIDVGYGQLAWSLRQHPRVVALERTNIRNLDRNRIPEAIDFAAVDVSFISLKIVIPAFLPLMNTDGRLVALIKPQFEVGKGKVGKGGVVRDHRQHAEVVDDLVSAFSDVGLSKLGVMPSPILGPKGNREFLIYLQHIDIKR